MPQPAAFQLESLSYQTDAVDSVVRVFEGTPKPAVVDLAGNRCALTWAQISANLLAIDAGFKVFKLQMSIVPRAVFASDPDASEADQLDLQLTPIAEVTANQIYRARDQQTPHREAIVCFVSHLETTTLDWLHQQKGHHVIVLEAALDTTGKWNLHHQLGDGVVVF